MSMHSKHGQGLRHPYKTLRFPFPISFIDEETGEPMESVTQQQFKKQCDINHILKQYDKTGLITHVNEAKAFYGDYTEVNEYQESLNLVIRAQDNFMSLPSKIRNKFHNNPGEYLEFVSNPENQEEMYELGLAIRPMPERPMQVEVVNQPAATAANE